MKEYNLNYLRKIRILDSSDLKTLSMKKELEQIYETKTNKNIKFKNLICELYVPRGARIVYGILGYTFIENNNNNLKIFFPEENNNTFYSEKMLRKDLNLGLSQEYKNSIEQGIDSMLISNKEIPEGILNINYCAHCDTGSNDWAFRKLSQILMGIFLGAEPSEDYFKNMLDNDKLSV